MKLGLALKPEMWSDAHLAMAQQLGCESVVAWVPFGEGDGVWHESQLEKIKSQAQSHGLELAAIENLHPGHWDHVVLGEPGREQQIENIKQTIRNMGAVGIPCLGYSFSVCGVQGYFTDKQNRDGRGGAAVKQFDVSRIPTQSLPNNQSFWFNTTLTRRSPEGHLKALSEDELWTHLTFFLQEIIPVAEASGVVLAAHPDDPPVPVLRGFGRLLYSVENLQRLIDLVPSPSNRLEFCQGTISSMPDADMPAVIERFASQGKIAYVHFRNVSGQMPRFTEVFIDEGDTDMLRAMKLYERFGFSGTLIPDHTPGVEAQDPWETGMAYCLGYIRAAMQAARVSP